MWWILAGLLLAYLVALALHGRARRRELEDDIPTLDMRPTPPERPEAKRAHRVAVSRGERKRSPRDDPLR
jgi:hypothetical protein